MPAKKKLRSEAERPSDETVAWIKANDALIGDAKVTIASLFANCTIKTFNEQKYNELAKKVMTTGRVITADWGVFRAALEARTAESPLWFVQRRVEDLLLEPDGTIGERVESFVIVEAPHATLAPRHYILAEPLPDADPEDHVPSRVMDLADQDVKWNPITKDDGSLINAYVLQRKSAVPAFSFGAAPAASVAPAPAAAPAAGGFGFGFGAATATPAAPAAGFGFSFGTAAPAAAPAPAAGFSFGFGTAAPAAVAPVAVAAPAAATLTPPAAVKRIPTEDILFTIWDEERAREMKKLATSGSRIVIEDFKLPNATKTVKLVMQDDVKEKPAAAAAEFILKKLFARQCERITSFDAWMDECPEIEPHLLEFLQKTREKMLKAESRRDDAEEGEKTYATIFVESAPSIIAALTAAVERRKPIHKGQCDVLDEIQTLLEEQKMVSKDRCRILKFYPSNKEVPFRPFGKVSGISEEGEEAICDPPAYRFVNPFTGKSS